MTKNILIRSLSGIVLLIVFLISIFLFRPLLYVNFYLIAAFMLIEWYDMTKESTVCKIMGQILIPLPIAALMVISWLDVNGWILATYFCIIWSVDVMAMFGGKIIGGMKLAPKISPNKTVSGLVFGVLGAIINVNFLYFIPSYKLSIIPDVSHITMSFYVLIIGILAQISDLSVSFFKRRFGIKDTGNIIPGHGGVLDRFDSIILTAPIVTVFLLSQL